MIGAWVHAGVAARIGDGRDRSTTTRCASGKPPAGFLQRHDRARGAANTAPSRIADSIPDASSAVIEDQVFAKCERRADPLPRVALSHQHRSTGFLNVRICHRRWRLNADLGFSARESSASAAGIFFVGYMLFQVRAISCSFQFGGAPLVCSRFLSVWGAISAAWRFVQGPTSFLRFCGSCWASR
jgi:hypothetical protein